MGAMTGVIGMSKNDGGTAFPCRVRNDGVDTVIGFHGDEISPGTTSSYGGMSLRDYFAAKATDEDISEARDDHFISCHSKVLKVIPLTRAQAKYAYADAMLAERAK